MRRKFEAGVLMLCSLLLGANGASATFKDTFGPLGVTEAVPEVDFRGLGSVGIATLLLAGAYAVQKGYRKFVARKKG